MLTWLIAFLCGWFSAVIGFEVGPIWGNLAALGSLVVIVLVHRRAGPPHGTYFFMRTDTKQVFDVSTDLPASKKLRAWSIVLGSEIVVIRGRVVFVQEPPEKEKDDTGTGSS